MVCVSALTHNTHAQACINTRTRLKRSMDVDQYSVLAPENSASSVSWELLGQFKWLANPIPTLQH